VTRKQLPAANLATSGLEQRALRQFFVHFQGHNSASAPSKSAIGDIAPDSLILFSSSFPYLSSGSCRITSSYIPSSDKIRRRRSERSRLGIWRSGCRSFVSLHGAEPPYSVGFWSSNRQRRPPSNTQETPVVAVVVKQTDVMVPRSPPATPYRIICSRRRQPTSSCARARRVELRRRGGSCRYPPLLALEPRKRRAKICGQSSERQRGTRITRGG
jgi:hypothetical protein